MAARVIQRAQNSRQLVAWRAPPRFLHRRRELGSIRISGLAGASCDQIAACYPARPRHPRDLDAPVSRAAIDGS
jgi:hypothetical protein